MQAARTHEQIAHRLEQIPGVQSVGLDLVGPDGRSGEHDPIFVEDFPGPGGRIPPHPQVQDGRGRLLPDARAPGSSPGATLTWADSFDAGCRWWRSARAWRGSTGRTRPRRSAAASGTAPTARGGPSSASSATSATRAWPSRRRRSSTGRCVIAEVLEPRRPTSSAALTLRGPDRPAKSPTLLKEIQQAVWSVNGGAAGRQRADAERDHVRVDGADLVRAGHAGASPLASRCCSGSSASGA